MRRVVRGQNQSWSNRLTARRNRGWLFSQVAERLEADRPSPRRTLSQAMADLALPDPRVTWMGTGLVALLVPVSWGLSVWNPQLMTGASGVDVLTPGLLPKPALTPNIW